MGSHSFGSIFRITTWGESHGPAIGVVIDGCPAGLELSVNDLIPDLKRRAPGQSDLTSPRKEDDIPEILSGVFRSGTKIKILPLMRRLKISSVPDMPDLPTLPSMGFLITAAGAGLLRGRRPVESRRELLRKNFSAIGALPAAPISCRWGISNAEKAIQR